MYTHINTKAMSYDNADGSTAEGVNSYISWQTLLILLVWYNHHKMYAVLHKTPPTCCKVHANVVVFSSILHTLGFQCWLSG